MKSEKEILIKVLELIGFTAEKEAFADDFIRNIQLQAFLDLVKSQVDQNQDKIRGELNSGPQNAMLSQILKKYFTDDQIARAIENASRNAMTEYLKDIEPTLSKEQKEALMNFFTELNDELPKPVNSTPLKL